ncbi:MAG: phosphate signaling complex protein PhoU [Tissierellales bacterium]|jgi:phosphate transport system protein|nr:phosphate signaling complex protein PhoU [Tissierellales bacterium]MBN2827483.1 phosphate signaling complex protein PhoU [Tissierellales bacterium]
MREKYDEQLIRLNQDILGMGAMAEKILDMAIKALLEKDYELACEVIEFEKEIDKKEAELEERCINLIALQQPLAKDLRRITAIIKMISDLERIGDLSENIAEIVIKIGKDEFIKPLVDTPKMAEITKEMIKLSLDCFVKEDIVIAEKVFAMDDDVDNLYKEIYTELLAILGNDSSTMNQVVDLLFIGRYLERIADHSTNICEHVYYMVTGEKKQKNKN